MSAQVFGKLPGHGDFVARGLNAADRAVWDAWLSGSLVAARDRWGEAFDTRFDAALPWRCAGPNVAGAIAASQDAAGRRFPVIVLAAGAVDQAAACEALLYAAIGDRWSVDRLAEAAGAAPPGVVTDWHGPDGTTLAGNRPATLLTAMLA